jgi:phenylacetate-CoA ligase
VIAREKGLSLSHRPSHVVTGAEKLLKTQRADIAAFTGAVLTDQYGLSEGCGNASHCEQFAYHEDFEFGIIEPLDPVRNADNSVSARVIMTGFACPEFPLIRYEVGDRAVWESPDKECPCGRASTVIREIEGRVEDYVVTPEGRRIMRFDYCFKDSTNVREAQVVQRRMGEVVLRIVRRPSYSIGDERDLVDQIHHWISPNLSVAFEYVDDIPREIGGKFRAVKSELR